MGVHSSPFERANRTSHFIKVGPTKIMRKKKKRKKNGVFITISRLITPITELRVSYYILHKWVGFGLLLCCQVMAWLDVGN